MVLSSLVLPGDPIPPEALPTPANPSMPLKVGPGLRYFPPGTIEPVVAGELCIDHKKNAVWVESDGGRVSISALASALLSYAEPVS